MERQTLQGWVSRRKSAQALALRARVVLACAEDRSNGEVAHLIGVDIGTVRKWRNRFAAKRLDGLCDEPRAGRPRTISDAAVEAVVVATLESTPEDATHWSRRSMAARSGLSASTIGRIWKAFRLQPHRSETFKLSTDPLFVDKLYDVVGLYLDPPQAAMVLCVDEKSQVQALDRSQPALPMMPGMPERRTHDYVRHGVTSLFAAMDTATGRVIAATHRRHRHQEFIKFLKTVDANAPADVDLHLIMDNYQAHKTPAVDRWLQAHPRFYIHFIPTGSSWLNLVERWFAELTRKLLQRGAHRSVHRLEADLRRWVEHWNNDPKPYVWTKTAEEILTSLARFCLRTSGAGH